MCGLINRTLLWITCTFVLIMVNGITAQTVVITLFCLQLICIGLYLNHVSGKMCVLAIFILVSFKYGMFLHFLPLMLYEYTSITMSVFFRREGQENESPDGLQIQEENEQPMFRYGWAKNVYSIASVLLPLLLFSSFVNNYQIVDTIYRGILIFFSIIAACMEVLSYRYYELKKLMIKTRDNNMELTIALKNRNQYLIEKQDYEIYLATLHERNRIAREIHDNVGHMLSRSILQMGAVLTVNKEKSMEPLLIGVKDTLDLAMGRIRESVHDLHDESIDLKAAVVEITENDLKKFKVIIDYDMTGVVPRTIKYCFISVVREAVENINKHCNGDSVFISMREHPVFYRLEVSDNGDASSDKNGPQFENNGIGLNNIKERVENLQGTIHFNYKDGFKIVISIPKK